MGWVDLKWETRGECDRCGLVIGGEEWSYPPDHARRMFCRAHGWARRGSRLLCSGCLAATLPDFPAWAVEGQEIRSVGVWSSLPVGTRAVVVGRWEGRDPVAALHRSISIRPLDGGRWGGNLWLAHGGHLLWRPWPPPDTSWSRIVSGVL